MDWITPHIAIWEYPSSRIDLAQVEAIVNLDRYSPYKTDVHCAHMPLEDGPGNEPGRVVEVVHTLDRLLEAGRVLVHCASGVSRSPFVVALYLSWRQELEFDAALAQVARSRRREVLVNPGLLALTDDVLDLLRKDEAT